MSSSERGWTATWTAGIVLALVISAVMGAQTHSSTKPTLAAWIGMSSIFWALGALFPMWWPEKVNRAGLMNGIAAACAMYAGLAALGMGSP